MTKQRRLALIALIIAAIFIIAAIVKHIKSRTDVLIGVVDANEITVTPPVQAWVDTLLVDEGAQVTEGQPIAQLDRSEIGAQASAAASSAVSARAQLAEAASNAVQTAREASAAQASARARVSQAQAQLASAQAELERKRNDARRMAVLLKSGSISDTDLEHANTDVRVAEAAATAAREALNVAQADLAHADAAILSAGAAQRNVAAMRAQLRGAEADSAAAGSRLGYTDLRAPVSGVVNVIMARQGELVGPNAPVAVIVDIDHLWVRVAAPESDVGAVAVGDSLDVRFESGLKLRGRVMTKNVEGDFATQRDVSSSKRDIRAVGFRVAIPNPHHVIVPGMTAQVILPRVRK